MRECVNCKYSKGSGSDVWCGHNPKGDEAYMFETDCPYFRWWNDDEKRFTTDYSDFLQNDKTFIKRGNERLTYKEIVDLLNEQQATITELAKKWRVLSQENVQLKDYIDTIFEDNTHICKYLDVEDVQFYCDKNKNYRNPSCLYEKCFDEENLIKIKDEIRRVLE